MKQILAITIIMISVSFSSWAQSLVASPEELPQQGEDPCLTQVQKTIKASDVLEETDVIEYAHAKGLGESAHSKLFGRFFKATFQKGQKSKSVVYWTIPYAQGHACVIRDIKKL